MNRLQQHLASMVALEGRIEKKLAEIVGGGIAHSGADGLLGRIHAMAKTQHRALSARFEAIRNEGKDLDTRGTVPILGDLTRIAGSDSNNSVSFALHTVATMLNHAIFGYTMLQALAHRYLDSKTAGGENTGDVSEQHTRDYAAVVQEVNQMIQNVVLWELARAGDECRCTCPSCGLGVCLCALSSRVILNSAWAETAPAPGDGVLVQQPKSGSAAAMAELQAGDIVLTADGQVLHAPPDLQSVVSGHQPGEDITLQVRKNGGETLDVVVTRP